MSCTSFCMVSLVLSSVVPNPLFGYRSVIYDNSNYSTISYIPQLTEVRPTDPRLAHPTSRLWHTLSCIQADYPNQRLPASTSRIDCAHVGYPNPNTTYIPPSHPAPTTPGLCLTPGCVKAAAELIKQMDQTTHPCTDFFQFACGGYLDGVEATLAEHESRAGKSTALQNKLLFRLKQLFESQSARSEPRVYSSVRNLYKTCMDTDNIKEMSLKDLKGKLRSLGGWPVLEDSWYKPNFRWYDLAHKARNEGFDYNQMISVDIYVNPKDSEERMIEIDQPQFGLEREYLIKGFYDKDVQAYFNYMVQTAMFFGAKEENAIQEMRKVLELEMNLADMSLSREERRNKTALYNPMTIYKANQLYPEIPLVKFINNILGSRDVVHYGSDIVNVKVPRYMTDFKNYISRQPSRVQANYIIWRIVKNAMNYMNETAEEIQLTYEKAITGKAQKTSRWKKCVQSTAGLQSPNLYFKEGSLSNAVGAMYAKKYFDLGGKDIVDGIVENVRSEFKKMLDEQTWMDYRTKTKAIRKIDQIAPHVAYAKEIMDKKHIDEYYNGLYLTRYSEDSFLKNIFKLKKFIYDYNIQEFRNRIDKRSWKTHGGAAFVHSSYSREENSLQIPAGMLQGVFSSQDIPLYLQYGAIGFDIGHEITHALDDEGIQYDGRGN